MSKINPFQTARNLLNSGLAKGIYKGVQNNFINPLVGSLENIGTTGVLMGQAAASSTLRPFAPQTAARIASPNILGTQTRGQMIMDNKKQALQQQLVNSARLGLSATGLGSGAKTLAATAAFSGGLGSMFAPKGQRLEALGEGISSAPLYAGMGVASRVATTPLLTKLFPSAVNAPGITGRAGQAAFNIGENIALDLSTGQGKNAFNPLNIGMAGIAGFAGRPFAQADNVRIKNTAKLTKQGRPPIRAPMDLLISHEGAPDEQQVLKYMKQIQEGKGIEPLIIIKEGSKYGIEDGKHRFEALRRLGHTEAPVVFRTKQQYTKDPLGRFTGSESVMGFASNEVKTKTPEASGLKAVTQSELDQSAQRLVPGQDQVKIVTGKVTSQTLKSSIPQKEKYAFNINKPRLGLEGEAAKKLDQVVEEMRPILQENKGKPLTNKEIITGGRKADLLTRVMTREESAQFAESLQASRNFLKSESGKAGLTPEFLAQLEVVSSQAADKGRSLRAFAVDAESKNIKQEVIKDLQDLGIEADKILKAAKGVDWNNEKQVTEFYRKFKPASLLEKIDEYRYTNMLSSPSTQIVNAFSNLIQGGLVTPVEKTVTGALDFARSRLTGTEQKYFASQGVDYAKGYWKSLPDGWNQFKKAVGGEGTLKKPDVNYLPTSTSKFHKLYTTPLRALEGMDQLARTMVKGGEYESLKKSNLSEAEMLKRAEQSADYRTFRQAFDPKGKLGQGGLLKLWDKWNVGVNNLRNLPGGKWIVPFLQTPTNILKQGVEYSPAGFATIPGSKEPMEQLSKAIIGTGVFTAAYALADAGLTTWDTPTNTNDKNAFYEAGLQPYSVKIGDKWVSYSKLGPLSYPIAMAASLKWAQENGAEENDLLSSGKGLGGFLQFFADQSYMQGIGDVIDAVRGDEFKQGRSLANIPSQLVPYRAMQGWFARLIDPVYRKTTGGSVPEQAYKSVISQIPFASKTLPAYTTSTGEDSQRYAPGVNAVSPFKITKQTGPYLPVSSQAVFRSLDKMTPEQRVERLRELKKNNPTTFSNVKKLIIDRKLGTTKDEVNLRNSSVTNRASQIYRQMKNMTPEERVALLKDYQQKSILTDSVKKELARLIKENQNK